MILNFTNLCFKVSEDLDNKNCAVTQRGLFISYYFIFYVGNINKWYFIN